MKLQKNEIDELIRIVETSDLYYGIGIGNDNEGEVANVCNEDTQVFWCQIGKYVRIDESSGYFKKLPFSEETKTKLSATLSSFKGQVILFRQGTHCGALVFQCGWMHEEETETDEMTSVPIGGKKIRKEINTETAEIFNDDED